MTNPIKAAVEAVDMETQTMRIALNEGDLPLVEYHANRLINLLSEIRRNCFLETHVSGEVK